MYFPYFTHLHTSHTVYKYYNCLCDLLEGVEVEALREPPKLAKKSTPVSQGWRSVPKLALLILERVLK